MGSPEGADHSHQQRWPGPARKAATISTRFGETSDRAGIDGLTFHDRRGTAVTRFSEAGCTPQEIRAITGYGIDSIERIIERYCARTDLLASNAVVNRKDQRMNGFCKIERKTETAVTAKALRSRLVFTLIDQINR